MTHYLWLDLGNTRLKYWISDQHGELLEQDAELHLQSPPDLLLGLVSHLRQRRFAAIGISSVLDQPTNQRIADVLQTLQAPIFFAHVQHHYAGLTTGYDVDQLGIDRWLQVLAMTQQPGRYCIVGCGTALTIDLLDGLYHQGGYILPSLYLQRDALTQGTKGIRIPPQAFADLDCGRTTGDAVHHGIALGLLGAILTINQLYPHHQLILTGGDAALFADLLSQSKQLPRLFNPPLLMPDLLLAGLQRYLAHQYLDFAAFAPALS